MASKIDLGLAENLLAERIIGICIEIHKELGPGLFESVYEEAVAYELEAAGIEYSRQKAIPVNYKGRPLAVGFRADFIVEDLIVLEIKSVEFLAPVHSKQLLTYLNLTKLKLGFLINFNEYLLKDGLKRIANNL